MEAFKDHTIKHTIREGWWKPLVVKLSEITGSKLNYLGLPAPRILDLVSWDGHINRVIAFQPNTTQQLDGGLEVSDIDVMHNNLNDLELEEKIYTFSLFEGFMEPTIMRRKDDKGRPFNVKHLYHIYNLDFCNNLITPLKYYDKDTKRNVVYYKMEVIGKLLDYQQNISLTHGEKKFITFLTIHSNFLEEEMERHDFENDPVFQEYIDKVGKITNGLQRKIRLLKAYTYYFVSAQFRTRGFIPEFLTPVLYRGSGGHWLLMFTILGCGYNDPSGSAPNIQDTASFLNAKFSTATETEILQYDLDAFGEDNIQPNSLEQFKNSRLFNEYWTKS